MGEAQHLHSAFQASVTVHKHPSLLKPEWHCGVYLAQEEIVKISWKDECTLHTISFWVSTSQ